MVLIQSTHLWQHSSTWHSALEVAKVVSLAPSCQGNALCVLAGPHPLTSASTLTSGLDVDVVSWSQTEISCTVSKVLISTLISSKNVAHAGRQSDLASCALFPTMLLHDV